MAASSPTSPVVGWELVTPTEAAKILTNQGKWREQELSCSRNRCCQSIPSSHWSSTKAQQQSHLEGGFFDDTWSSDEDLEETEEEDDNKESVEWDVEERRG
jgi:hypothetical protein